MRRMATVEITIGGRVVTMKQVRGDLEEGVVEIVIRGADVDSVETVVGLDHEVRVFARRRSDAPASKAKVRRIDDRTDVVFARRGEPTLTSSGFTELVTPILTPPEGV